MWINGSKQINYELPKLAIQESDPEFLDGGGSIMFV